MGNKAIILDRDGVINRDVAYTHRIEDLEILPGAIKGLQKIKKADYLIIIISNQSGIGRGYYTKNDLSTFNQYLFKLLSNHQITIDGFYYCPHHPQDNCKCRKPNSGLLRQAIKDFSLDIKKCIVVGDQDSDFYGLKYGFTSVWIKNNQYPHKLATDYSVNSLEGLANLIIA